MALCARMACLKASILTLSLLFFQFSHAQYNFGELDGKFPQLEKDFGGKLVIMVYKDGKTVYSKSTKDFLPNNQEPVGSCGKWITAAMVMEYVDEGKISLDDKISKYLPIFSSYSKGYITLRNCLTHFTGIEGDKGTGVAGGLSVMPSLENEVNSYASSHEIQTNAGTAFRYSNIGLNIAARIIEVVSKREFEQIVQQKLLRPLGMRNTTFQFDYGKGVSASIGAYSSAQDLENFMAMLMDKGMFKGKRILSEKAVAQLEELQVDAQQMKYAPPVLQGMDYALGSWIMEKDGNGKPTCFTAPSFAGTWPVMDLCRGYALVVFAKGKGGEERKQELTQIKAIIDGQIPCN